MATTAEPAMTGSLASDAETAKTPGHEGDLQEEQCNIVCNAVLLCFLWNNMDLIVHDTLIKLTCDYFEASVIETAKRTLFEGNAVAASDVPFCRRKGQFKNKHNVEDILFVLHKHPVGLPAFAVCDLSSLAASARHQECRLRPPIRRDVHHQSGDGEFARDCR